MTDPVTSAESTQTLTIPDDSESSNTLNIRHDKAPLSSNPNDEFQIETETKMHRKLQARHLEMIAIGGAIGTGLLLKSGGAIYTAGPVGALLCYAIVGLQVFGVTTGIGEMATFLPVAGAFSQLPARFVNAPMGFVGGWNYWLNWALTVPAELSAIASFMSFWTTAVPLYTWAAVYLVPLAAVNMIGVGGFGEAEFILSLIKVIAIGVFLAIGICVWFGAGTSTGPLWFRYWNPAIIGDSPGARFINFSSALITALFSYGGTELVGLTAREAANPRRNVPRAIKGTFYRIVLFYLGSIFLVGVLLPSDSAILNPNGGAERESPFVYVYGLVGIHGAAHVMNAVAVVAALSAANSSVYACSRTLMRLAEEGNAPTFLQGVDARGVPVRALVVSLLCGVVAVVGGYLAGTGAVFNFLSGVVALGILTAWMIMSLTHLRFRYGYVAQGKAIQDLPYIAPYFPYVDYFSLLVGGVIIALMVFDALYQQPFDFDWWMNNSWLYGGIPLIASLFLGRGISDGMKSGQGILSGFALIPYGDMDFETGKLVESEEDIAQNAMQAAEGRKSFAETTTACEEGLMRHKYGSSCAANSCSNNHSLRTTVDAPQMR
ncbi:hypothetical protein CcCBS67573_g01653 [Chytriomyces confervae]|uniref:Amino acid permease/ SLC12A domain-containing protein n=1 Tax=Chytriomyces confervae TaxID=246404 RepID=A0A507FKY5_9FUNG|nr:hypothetical protein CcCBS67573_g01653 [Chytriomyces confervae]